MRWPVHIRSVEQVAQEAFAPTMAAAVAATVATTMLAAPAMLVAKHAQCAARFLISRLFGHATFDDLVEFAAIEPNPPALRAIIDFDACRSLMTRSTLQTGQGRP